MITRSRPALACLAAGLAGSLLLSPAQNASAQDTFSSVERIVAVGDVHGGFDQFVAVLRDAGVIDGGNRWRGGRTHLVQTGDVLDRGVSSRKVMDLLMRLEREASRAGGRVHALIGNHEVMNVLGDLRYVSAEEYAAFRTSDSESLRERAYGVLADPAQKNDSAYRDQWYKDHPPGWVEHRQAFSGDGTYGKWIRQHQAVVRINDTLFLHGGIGPKYADLSIEDINRRIRNELNKLETIQDGLSGDDEGPLWYRGLAQDPEPELGGFVDRLLQSYGVRHIVVGHTIVAPAIVPRLDGKVITIDVGLSAFYGGPPACLLIEGGRFMAVHRGTRVELPLGGSVRSYLERIAALDPSPSPLLKVLDQLAPRVPEPVGQP